MSDNMMIPKPTEMSVAEIEARLEKFNQLKKTVLEPHTKDIHGKKYILKSGWRVAATVFGLADDITHTERQERDDGSFTITYHVRCTDPQGRTSMGVASCDSRERPDSGQRLEHDVATLAHTRAKNRAISDIIGTGEVSAEEMLDSDGNTSSPNTPRTISSRYDGKCKVCGKSWKAGSVIAKVGDRWCCDVKCKESKDTTPTTPTAEQLQKLQELEYKGPPPPTRFDAANVIAEMLVKKDSK